MKSFEQLHRGQGTVLRVEVAALTPPSVTNMAAAGMINVVCTNEAVPGVPPLPPHMAMVNFTHVHQLAAKPGSTKCTEHVIVVCT